MRLASVLSLSSPVQWLKWKNILGRNCTLKRAAGERAKNMWAAGAEWFYKNKDWKIWHNQPINNEKILSGCCHFQCCYPLQWFENMIISPRCRSCTRGSANIASEFGGLSLSKKGAFSKRNIDERLAARRFQNSQHTVGKRCWQREIKPHTGYRCRANRVPKFHTHFSRVLNKQVIKDAVQIVKNLRHRLLPIICEEPWATLCEKHFAGLWIGIRKL